GRGHLGTGHRRGPLRPVAGGKPWRKCVNGVGDPRRGLVVTFDEYVRLRGPALVRLARLIAGDRHRGEDLVQEVLTKAYPRWSRILAGGQPEVYLRRMLINAHLSWRRKRSSSETADGLRIRL